MNNKNNHPRDTAPNLSCFNLDDRRMVIEAVAALPNGRAILLDWMDGIVDRVEEFDAVYNDERHHEHATDIRSLAGCARRNPTYADRVVSVAVEIHRRESRYHGYGRWIAREALHQLGRIARGES